MQHAFKVGRGVSLGCVDMNEDEVAASFSFLAVDESESKESGLVTNNEERPREELTVTLTKCLCMVSTIALSWAVEAQNQRFVYAVSVHFLLSLTVYICMHSIEKNDLFFKLL